ncbi:hypothetical protein SELMODRAFT_98843 [Selaginella moellendorffii]|uniref:Prolyl endopeptidase n=1 Tax=Selaginella moellendorffii TaxID=88036 RepID=D8RPR1_SELML|nr:hypothetical protein SELMODRAFT_98843 [Selaginella moellendorffii]
MALCRFSRALSSLPDRALRQFAPAAPRRSFPKTRHGVTWDDPYHWLRNSEDPAVIAYLQAENQHAQSTMAGTRELQRQIRQEMASRMEKELASPPERWGDWYYFVHIPQGKEFPIYSRRRACQGGRLKAFFTSFFDKNSEVMIDINELAAEHGHAQLGVFKLSRDHKLLAYTIDLGGNEIFTLFIKDLETDSLLLEHKTDGVVSVEWSDTGDYLYYTCSDAAHRPHRVLLRNLRSKDDDIAIYHDDNPKNFVDVTRTKNWQYVLINVNSKTSSEVIAFHKCVARASTGQVFLVDPKTSATTLRKVADRVDGIQYFVEHHEEHLYILTNFLGDKKLASLGNNYRLVRCKTDSLTSKAWEEVVPVDSENWIEDMDIFAKHLILYRRQNGLPIVHVFNLDVSICLKTPRTVNLPSGITVLTPGANCDFNSSTLRLSISSLVMPEATYDVDLTTGEVTLLQQVKIVGVDTGSYCMKHLAATSHDGVRVPLTIVYSNKFERKGENSALVTGYGAYGELLDMSFSSDRLSLLDRGWVLAFAHVRGSGTLGKAWHSEGKLLKKENSFKDFIACIRYLVENQYASRNKIAAFGESAGGLLVGAAVNLQPDLFRAIILKVPFLDILNTMLDSSLSLTEHEYDEWGDPSSDKAAFDCIRNYSPYDNIKPGVRYPAMLVTSSFLDTRVGYWESAKWIAALRHSCQAECLVFKTNMSGGHFGDGGRYSHLKETAYGFAFLIKNLEAI